MNKWIHHKIYRSVWLGVISLMIYPHLVFAQTGEWDVSGFMENVSHYRDNVGMSKARNTVQLELNKDFGTVSGLSNFSVNFIFRGTYDAVYDINDEDFGSKAGGPVMLAGRGVDPGILGRDAPAVAAHSTPFGGSLIGGPIRPGPSPQFGFDTDANPNEGLAILGEALHGQTGVVLAYPVRPCNVDSRGCIEDYLDYSENDLRFPEFNDHFDFIRELYIDGTVPFDGGGELGIRLGKQQVVWGRTDLFRVLDVLNPVDYSRHNIYDELEDIRIPQWMLNLEARFGSVGPFADLNFAVVWNFDEFRPNSLGQGGSPYSILDAGSFFRAMHMCWTLGCSVGNFAGGGVTTDFGPGQIGIRKANVPDWKFDNTQYGLKLEGVLNEVGFSLNYIDYISQLPSLHANAFPAQNSFTGARQIWPYLIAFDIEFPRIQLYGGSLDFYVDAIQSAVRIEAAYTQGEEFADTTSPELYSTSDVFRYVIGVDQSIFLPFVKSNSAALISAQIFGQHILDHNLEESAGSRLGLPGFTKRGMPDWEENWTATLLIRQPFKNGLINTQLIMAHDFKAEASVAAPSIEFLVNDNWRIVFGGNFKFGEGARAFDDCRTCNPWGPYTATPFHRNDPSIIGSVGLGGFEPLGRFRSGPIGMAQAEDEIQLTVRYRF